MLWQNGAMRLAHLFRIRHIEVQISASRPRILTQVFRSFLQLPSTQGKCWYTNSMEKSLFRQAISRSATQEIYRLLQNKKFIAVLNRACDGIVNLP
jgi:hypothetical protein